jgi:large subunit ribosomal protein L10
MSKYVKNLVTEHLRSRLSGVGDALLINLSALDSVKNNRLRLHLRDKKIQLMVVKNSLARRATEGTALGPAFEGLEGSTAVVWGAEDIVALAKEVTAVIEDKQYQALAPRGGVIDGSRIAPEQIKEVSKWPSRGEMLSIISGQILSPGATLNGQLIGIGGALASQIEKRAKSDEAEGGEAAGGEAAPEAPAA